MGIEGCNYNPEYYNPPLQLCKTCEEATGRTAAEDEMLDQHGEPLCEGCAGELLYCDTCELYCGSGHAPCPERVGEL